jgi:hypothetical protein
MARCSKEKGRGLTSTGNIPPPAEESLIALHQKNVIIRGHKDQPYTSNERNVPCMQGERELTSFQITSACVKLHKEKKCDAESKKGHNGGSELHVQPDQ